LTFARVTAAAVRIPARASRLPPRAGVPLLQTLLRPLEGTRAEDIRISTHDGLECEILHPHGDEGLVSSSGLFAINGPLDGGDDAVAVDHLPRPSRPHGLAARLRENLLIGIDRLQCFLFCRTRRAVRRSSKFDCPPVSLAC
jgi:hypothetical protein